MEKKELHPQIFLIEDFLTPQECDYYIELANGGVFEEAK
jgi:prolyl 4-hydroxylase